VSALVGSSVEIGPSVWYRSTNACDDTNPLAVEVRVVRKVHPPKRLQRGEHSIANPTNSGDGLSTFQSIGDRPRPSVARAARAHLAVRGWVACCWCAKAIRRRLGAVESRSLDRIDGFLCHSPS
jgi:hypothetical protein